MTSSAEEKQHKEEHVKSNETLKRKSSKLAKEKEKTRGFCKRSCMSIDALGAACYLRWGGMDSQPRPMVLVQEGGEDVKLPRSIEYYCECTHGAVPKYGKKTVHEMKSDLVESGPHKRHLKNFGLGPSRR